MLAVACAILVYLVLIRRQAPGAYIRSLMPEPTSHQFTG